jgi:hypothetical protein
MLSESVYPVLFPKVRKTDHRAPAYLRNGGRKVKPRALMTAEGTMSIRIYIETFTQSFVTPPPTIAARNLPSDRTLRTAARSYLIQGAMNSPQ